MEPLVSGLGRPIRKPSVSSSCSGSSGRGEITQARSSQACLRESRPEEGPALALCRELCAQLGGSRKLNKWENVLLSRNSHVESCGCHNPALGCGELSCAESKRGPSSPFWLQQSLAAEAASSGVWLPGLGAGGRGRPWLPLWVHIQGPPPFRFLLSFCIKPGVRLKLLRAWLFLYP